MADQTHCTPEIRTPMTPEVVSAQRRILRAILSGESPSECCRVPSFKSMTFGSSIACVRSSMAMKSINVSPSGVVAEMSRSTRFDVADASMRRPQSEAIENGVFFSWYIKK